MPWLRLWTDILDDPDLHELSSDAFQGWVLMLVSAKKFNREGELPPLKTLSHWMRKPRQRVTAWIVELTEAGFLEARDGTIFIHGWARWQEPKDKTNAARQAKFKAAKKTPPAPPPETEPETETEADACARARGRYPTVTEIGNGVIQPLPEPETAPKPPPASYPDSPDEIRVATLAAELGGDLSWSIWATRQFVMGVPADAVEAALMEAVNAGKLSQPYVGKIAARFKREGLPKAPSYSNGKPKIFDPGPTNQPISAQNLPDGLEQFTEKANRSRALAKAQGMDV